MASVLYSGAKTLGLRARTAPAAVVSVHRGFSPRTPERLASALNVTLADVAKVTRISPRTLARRMASGERLTPDESERVLRVASVYEQAVAFFGDAQAARNWLHAPREVFAGQTPLQMAETEVGSKEVERLLLRLAHGVYA